MQHTNTSVPLETDSVLLRDAEDPLTLGERLRDIAAHTDCTPALRAKIAQHPNCPPDLLQQYFPSFSWQVISNPALPLLLLENPQFFRTLPPASVKPILEEADTPPWLVEALRAHTHAEIAELAQWHVAINADISQDWQYKLNDWFFACAYKSARPEVEMEELLQLKLIPEKLQSEFSRRLVLYPEESPNAKESKEEQKEDLDVSDLVPRPEEKLEKLEKLEEKEARNPATPRKRLLEIAQSNNLRWNRALVGNTNAPAEVLAFVASTSLAARDREEILIQVALHPQTSVETQMTLLKAPLSVLRALAGRNSELSESVRLGVITALRQKEHRAKLGTGLYAFLLARLIEAKEISVAYPSPHWQERLGFALNPQLSDTQLLGLTTDANALVRAVARARRDDARVPTWFWGNIKNDNT
jgi:hypothetical protein